MRVGGAGDTYTPTGAWPLYALWTEIPAITVQPESQTVTIGDTVTLSVEAIVSDGGTLSYQWYCNDDPVHGAIDPAYEFMALAVGSFDYYCVVTSTLNGSSATVTSDNAAITVNAAVPSVFICNVKSMLAKVGKPQQIPYTYIGPGDVVITSSNPAVCAVLADGTLMPLKVGAAVITIEAPNGARVVFAVTVSM